MVHTWDTQNALREGGGGVELYLKPPKFEHIFEAVITFPPFFCTDTFDTNLLLIVCTLKWYVKCLYRHLFLEYTSKHAIALPNLWQGLFQGAVSYRPQIGIVASYKPKLWYNGEKLFLTWSIPELRGLEEVTSQILRSFCVAGNIVSHT